jgi:sugar/nucleoside kinase (ribokinase family)
VSDVAVIGNTTRDVVEGGPPRVGGPAFHAARALRLLGTRGRVVTRCAPDDRRVLLTRVVALGLPVAWAPGQTTAAFSFRYESDRRLMNVDALGDPWTPADARGWAGRGLGRAEWVFVGGVARSDFSVETLAELARGRRLLLDAQGLVRPDRTGPLVLDAEFDRDALRHVSMLKLAEEEAIVLAGSLEPEALRGLGVAEVLVTFGSRGSLVVAGSRVERVTVRPDERRVDPTGAGDAFCAAYLDSRAAGHGPESAARRASALVTHLLLGRAR